MKKVLLLQSLWLDNKNRKKVMKKIIVYIVALASIVGLASCLDDENDYNYNDVNELVGEIKNISTVYNIASGEELTITPTFKFTLDKENPDVSYEWLLNGKVIQGETGPSCTFSFERSGSHEVTYSVIDNKSGVKFSKSTRIMVRSPFSRGWLILSEGDSNESTLSFVGGSTVKYTIQVIDDDDGKLKDVTRDSLVYGHQIIRNVLPGLGSHPTGLALNGGFVSGYGEVHEISDEVMVMQDRWVELNGTTLERSVYTEEEFRGDLPEAGFAPLAAVMTYSAKALLNKDGYIYWANNRFANDFHACAYISVPINNGQKFTGLYPSYKVNPQMLAFPACTAENKIVGLMDAASTTTIENPLIPESSMSGNVCEVTTSSGDPDTRFHLGDKQILSMMPAACRKDWTVDKPSWLALLKDATTYKILFFTWETKKNGTIQVKNNMCFEIDLPGLTGYTDMAVFNNKQYVVIANGAELWYLQYGIGVQATMKRLHTFAQPIKSLGANDAAEGGWPVQPDHNGQLGVVLEDGTFWIYEVWQKKNSANLCTEASINQLFPDPKAEGPIDNKFGKVVDMLYKYGNIKDFLDFDY